MAGACTRTFVSVCVCVCAIAVLCPSDNNNSKKAPCEIREHKANVVVGNARQKKKKKSNNVVNIVIGFALIHPQKVAHPLTELCLWRSAFVFLIFFVIAYFLFFCLFFVSSFLFFCFDFFIFLFFAFFCDFSNVSHRSK